MKQQLCKTSSIIIDLQNSSFKNQILNEELIIYQHDLPSYLENKDFALLHNWAKDSLSLPYYIHIPSKHIYVWVSKGQVNPDLYFDNRKLSSSLFTDYKEDSKFHIVIKLLLAKYFELNESFVSNDKFFLYAALSKNENWATVLSVDVKHNFRNKSEMEFTVIDGATRLQKISVDEFEKYYKREIIYGQIYKKQQLLFKQLKRAEIKSFQGLLFAKPKKNISNSKAKINYHSIIGSAGHESSKAFLLERFTTNFLKFINDYGINAISKELELYKIEIERERTRLDIKNFNITLVDGRKVKAQNLLNLFPNFDEITFTQKAISELKNNDNCLFVMDYTSEDFIDRFKGEEDPYKSFKENEKYKSIAKQGICINENCFDDDINDLETSSSDYMEYKGLANEDLERNLGICINQLFLKRILLNKNASLLPHNKIFKTHCFCFRNYLLFVEGENLELEKFETAGELLEKVAAKFNRLDTAKLFEIIAKYNNPYSKTSDMDFLSHKIVFSNESVIEIVDFPERAFYDEEEIKQRIADRNKQRPKSAFRSNNSDKLSKLFNNFLDEEVENIFWSYEELKAKYGKGETGFLKKIFKAKNETAFLRFLNANTELKLKGLKQGGIFSIYTGVWFDESKHQYFVGRTHGYQHKQEKGSQMKKVVTHFGTFDSETFFQLLNVDFIRYKEITVNPYPFKLIEMYSTMISETTIKEEITN